MIVVPYAYSLPMALSVVGVWAIPSIHCFVVDISLRAVG